MSTYLWQKPLCIWMMWTHLFICNDESFLSCGCTGLCEEVKNLISRSQCYRVCKGSSRDHLLIFILHLPTEHGSNRVNCMNPTILLKDTLSCPMSTHFVSIMEAMLVAVGLPTTPTAGQTKCWRWVISLQEISENPQLSPKKQITAVFAVCFSLGVLRSNIFPGVHHCWEMRCGLSCTRLGAP